jgi:hypothetical protein
MTRNDIKDGDILNLMNNNNFIVIGIGNTKYLVDPELHYGHVTLADFCNMDLSQKPGKSAIVEIRRKGVVIWTKPVEMTIEQIEKALRLTPGSLRIKD